MKFERLKSNSGITLIALIITIIVLLILSGISISSLLDEEGIISQAKNANIEYKMSEYYEKTEMQISGEKIERYQKVKEELFIESVKKRIEEFENSWARNVTICDIEGNTFNDIDNIMDPQRWTILKIDTKDGYYFLVDVDNEKKTWNIRKEMYDIKNSKYKVILNLAGGKYNNSEEKVTIEVSKGFYFKFPEGVEKHNFEFTGWAETEEVKENESRYLEETKKLIEKDSEFYARWNQTHVNLLFDGNGGKIKEDEEEKESVVRYVEIGIKYILNDFDIKSPAENLGFDGWNTKEDGSGDDVKDEITIEDKDVTLYAQWKLLEFDVSFNYNGATGGNDEVLKKVIVGQKYGDLPNPTKTGYTFEGWYLDEEFNKEIYSDTVVENVEDNNLYANWSLVEYRINYELNGGTSNSDENPEKYTVEDSFTLKNPSKQNYTFAGWATTSNATSGSTNVTISKGSTGNKTYYATWTPISYTITYNLNGGTNNSQNPATYTVEDTVTLKNPTKDGFTFAGWATASNATSGSTNVTISNGSTGNKTYYATWTYSTTIILYHPKNSLNSTNYQTRLFIEGDGDMVYWSNETQYWTKTGCYVWDEDYWHCVQIVRNGLGGKKVNISNTEAKKTWRVGGSEKFTSQEANFTIPSRNATIYIMPHSGGGVSDSSRNVTASGFDINLFQ